MDVIDAIKQRRSINFFEPGREIPMEKVRELIDLALLSPSSLNLQPWKIVVVNDQERKKVLRKCAFDQPKVEESSVMLIMVADPDAFEENIDPCLDSWIELGYMKQEMKENYKGMAAGLYGTPDSFRRKSFAIKNTALLGMNLMLAAKGMGIETHPMDGFDEDAIKKEFNIPENKIIPMLIAVGYLRQGVTLLPRAYRRGFDSIVHINNY